MKCNYNLILVLFFVMAIAWVFFVVATPFGDNSHLEKAIQGIGIFVAIFTAIVALKIADVKKFVKTEVEVFIDNIDNTFKTSELPVGWTKFGEEVSFYRTNFKITNNSGFTLRNPTLSFRLPREKKSLQKVNDTYLEGFNSNIFNSREKVRFLEFADKIIISNSNLPYLNHEETQIIWFILFFGNMNPFTVELSINCENAEGITKKIRIKPKELLEKFNS